MYRKNKKGIELSINFLIVLILSLVVFIGGLAIVRNFFTKAQEYQSSIDRDTQNEIERLLTTGSKVAIPMNKRTIKIGKTDSFGLGINNVLPTTQEFEVKVDFNNAFDEFNKEIPIETTYMDKWTLTSVRTYTIKPNTHEQVLIPMIVGDIKEGSRTMKGTYIFNVCVCVGANNCPQDPSKCDSTFAKYYSDKLYTGKLLKIYVEVP